MFEYPGIVCSFNMLMCLKRMVGGAPSTLLQRQPILTQRSAKVLWSIPPNGERSELPISPSEGR